MTTTPMYQSDLAAYLDRQGQCEQLLMEISRKLHDFARDARYIYIGYQQIGVLQSSPATRLDMGDGTAPPKITLYGLELIEVHRPLFLEIG